MSETRNQLVRLTGLWVNEGANGRYLSGGITEEITLPAGTKIMIFENTKRERDEQPTHNLTVSVPEGKEIGREEKTTITPVNAPF